MSPHIPPPQEQDPVMMEKVMEPRSGSGFLLNEMLFPFVREGYEDLLQAVEGADLAAHSSDYFRRSAGRAEDGHPLGLECAGAVLVLLGLRSAGAAFLAMDATRSDLLGPRFVAAFFKQVKKIYKNEAYDQFRNELGLPDRGSPVFEGQHSPTLVLALFSRSCLRSRNRIGRRKRA